MKGRCRRIDDNSRRTNAKRKRATAEPVIESEETLESTNSSTSNKKVRWGNEVGDTEESGEYSTEEGTLRADKVCLAASCQSGRIGCAYYDPIKCTVYVCEDTPENRHYDLTKAFLEQCAPDIVITSSKADDGCIDVLRDHMDAAGGTFQIRPHKDFSPVKGRDRVLSLRLLSELPAEPTLDHASAKSGSNSRPMDAYDFMRCRREMGGDSATQRWNASIRLANYACIENSPLCLGSIGALLDHLARLRAVGELDDAGCGDLEIRAIEMLAPSQAMQINADALFSLQVFEDESHASIHSEKTKEGLSLFSILNNTKTTLGRALMRGWLLRPSLSLSVINSRHDAIACFSHPDNLVTADTVHAHLKGIKNIPRILRILRAGKAKVADWQGLENFAFHSPTLRDALLELSHASGVEVVERLIELLEVASLKEIANTINEIIDWEESTNAGRVCVRPRIDDELDNLRRIYHGIDSVLSKVAQQISATVPPDYATSLNVVYFPQLGFLICIPMLDEWQGEEGIKVLEGWSFQFSSELHVFFKSQEMHDMDAHIGDLHSSIVDREIEIVQYLLEKILVFDEALSYICDVCAELDCLLSFAEAAREHNYVRPQMTEDNIIDIKQGRHPLQELVVDTFVPNDAFVIGGKGVGIEPVGISDETASDSSRKESNSIVICTGANACGKSVYLKQVALIQYMAQIGSFVPAESATLGIVDKIFTRIQTRESVSRVQSAFMIDLNQVSLALRNATERSLILLDEFGKGTTSPDGAGLFCGVLKHLAGRGPTCPKVFATTHFHDVFSNGLISPDSAPISFVHMQILLTTDKGQVISASGIGDQTDLSDAEEEDDGGPRRVMPGEHITYLYRVAKGLSLGSHAVLCAEVFGIPRRVAKRAQYVSKLLSTHELGQLLDEEMREDERKDLEDAEDVCRRFLAWDLTGDRDNGRREDVRGVLAEVLGR
ncbi:hypothetical protein WOLCODRAFT_167438 [Wolfiporia cocos MD-104 SS10]|uniref:DNA mismatch repair proteins mutS family domain-containing protein n=1 Tax=Wolfiporia cocos (strain MD-104) TaxID=742152 RepID=A0A2H3JMX0_WOLCO|nr:hypothetical protein WOLCODRAFT_167438 [Wolfiporia cocos MD-104 SS10]